ncbi:hypothetical protein ACED32_17825 [Vibrio bivalvicida]
MKKIAVAVSVIASLLVGCGGGSGGGSTPDAKGNEGKGNEAKVVYPKGIYIATMGNGDSQSIKMANGKPEYMGVAFGSHEEDEQDLVSHLVGINEHDQKHHLAILGNYDSNGSPEETIMQLSKRLGSSYDREINMKIAGTWMSGDWRQALPNEQKVEIEAIDLSNNYSFVSSGQGFKIVAEDVAENGTMLDVLFQPVAIQKIANVVEHLPNTEWRDIDSYKSARTYNRYEFTQDGHGTVFVSALIEDGGVQYCKTKPRAITGEHLGEINQVLEFQTEVEDAGQCEGYFGNADNAPQNVEHEILIGFIEGNNGVEQMGVSHIGAYDFDSEGDPQQLIPLGGAGLFIRN